MTKKAQQYYERIYGKKWEDFNPAEKAQFEKFEADKAPIRGDKLLPKVVYKYHLFPKKPKYIE